MRQQPSDKPDTDQRAAHWLDGAPRTRAKVEGRIFHANVGDLEREMLEFAAQLERELATVREILSSASVTAIAAQNSSVREYCAHWEGRALKAEAVRPELQARSTGDQPIWDAIAALERSYYGPEDRMQAATKLRDWALAPPFKTASATPLPSAWSPVSKSGLLRGIRSGKPTAEDLAIAEADGDTIRYFCEFVSTTGALAGFDGMYRLMWDEFVSLQSGDVQRMAKDAERWRFYKRRLAADTGVKETFIEGNVDRGIALSAIQERS